MQKAIEKLKIGSRVLLGSYTAGNKTPEPIIWLKATPNCDFITEFALDFLCFDAKEPNNNDVISKVHGNISYHLANIFSFANSEVSEWYVPLHERDSAPDRFGVASNYITYVNHKGFLHYFEDYELASLRTMSCSVDGVDVTSLIRLPLADELIGADKFPLFLKRGVRPKASPDFIQHRGAGFGETSFMPYWCAGSTMRNGCPCKQVIGRAGSVQNQYPYCGSGFRPMCNIGHETVVEEAGQDLYRLVPFATSANNTYTDEDLEKFLGLS